MPLINVLDMKKPQTRQEMSDWLIVELLGFIYQGIGWTRSPVEYPGQICILHPKGNAFLTPEQFIYSPDGFFAVIKALARQKPPGKFERMELAVIQFLYFQDYEAFYNAVWEAW